MAHMVVRNGTLIDGTGAPPTPNAAVVITDSRIVSAGRESEVTVPVSPLTDVDAGGGFILPGFIDCHVHLMFEGVDMMKAMASPFSLSFYRAVTHMRRTLDAGVTTVRDAGGADLGVKRAVEEGLVAGPRMQISVTGLSMTGGHGDGWMASGHEFHLLPAHPGRPDGRCDGPEGVRRKVREILRAGAEVVKVHTTGGIVSTTSRSDFTQFSPEELRIIVEEASARAGTRVMAHAHAPDGVKNALRAGVHAIEHGIMLDDESIELMVRQKTFLVPTMWAMVSLLESASTPGGIPEWAVSKARQVADIHLESMRQAYRAGVRMSMGTDAAAAPHGTNLSELGLMCDIGMSPMEAIVSGTRVAAECLGWEDRIGTLEPGKLADVVVVSRDPLADIRSLAEPNNVTIVIKDGTIVKHLNSRGDRNGDSSFTS